MKIEFDPKANAAYVLISTCKVADTKEISPGIICDFDAKGKVIGIELLGFSQRRVNDIKALNLPYFEEIKDQDLKNWLIYLSASIKFDGAFKELAKY